MKKTLFCNKRGNAFFEVLTILLVLGAIVFTYVLVQSGMSEVTSDLMEDFDNSSESYEVIDNYETDTPSLLDGIIIFVFVGLWLSALVFAYFIDTHPVFFIVSLVFMIFVLILVAMFSNIFSEIIVEVGMTGFPMTNWLMTHLLPVMIGVAFSLMIALFARSRN